MMNKITTFIGKHVGVIVAIFFFIALVSLASKVTFMQNDDWYYYSQIDKFLGGTFQLHPDIAPTFHLQGFLGVLFSLFFGLDNLPILTLAFSILNFWIFYQILQEDFSLSTFPSLLLASIVLFNPLHAYGIWGFMTENYFLTFTLVGLYFFLKSKESPHALFLSNLIFLLSFFIRQLGLVFFLASALYFLYRKSFKKALVQATLFLGIYLFYSFVFPKTLEMGGKTLVLTHLQNLERAFSLVYGVLIYLTAFTAPLVLFVVFQYLWKLRQEPLKIIVFSLLSFGFYKLFLNWFNPEIISWGEFPYFENIFERMGFYPRSLHGTKYQFRGIYDLYYYWDFLAKILLSFFTSYVLLNIKRVFKPSSLFFLLYFVVYTGVIAITPVFFDRYIVTLIPIFILFLVSLLKKNSHFSYPSLGTLTFFTVFLVFFFYTLSCDFVLVESFVWNKSISLVKQGVSPNDILASSAWNEMHSRKRLVTYLFSYDSPNVNPELQSNFRLLETYIPDYFLNIHIDPCIYFYKRL